MSIKPITPQEAKTSKGKSFPNFVIAAFNEIIIEKLNGRYAEFTQGEIVSKIMKFGDSEDITRDKIYSKHWLDVEDTYRELGWRVEYDKPAYNETYEPTFKFVLPK